MSNPGPNPWHTAARSRNSHSATRTPQTRSATQSPSHPATPSAQPARQAPPPNNVWSQRASNGVAKSDAAPASHDSHQPVNAFNAAEVKESLKCDNAMATYKPAEASGTTWASKPSHMANNQPFFSHLAKQVATLEAGG